MLNPLIAFFLQDHLAHKAALEQKALVSDKYWEMACKMVVMMIYGKKLSGTGIQDGFGESAQPELSKPTGRKLHMMLFKNCKYKPASRTYMAKYFKRLLRNCKAGWADIAYESS